MAVGMYVEECVRGLEGLGHAPGMGPTFLKLCITKQNVHRHIYNIVRNGKIT